MGWSSKQKQGLIKGLMNWSPAIKPVFLREVRGRGGGPVVPAIAGTPNGGSHIDSPEMASCLARVVYICIHVIWGNYNNLTQSRCKGCLVLPKGAQFRLVNYYSLPRCYVYTSSWSAIFNDFWFDGFIAFCGSNFGCGRWHMSVMVWL